MNARAVVYVILSNLLGGASYVGAAYAMRGLSPEAAVFWRTLFGGALFIPFLFKGTARKPTRKEWLQMAAVGVAGLAAPLLIGTAAIKLTTTTNAALLVAVEPIAIVLLSALFLGESLTWLKAFAIASGVAGSTVLVLQGGFALTPHLKGDLLLCLHSVFWALYSVIGKDALKTVEPMYFSAVTTAFALVPISAAAVWSGLPLPPPATWGAIAFLSVGVTFLGVLLWNKALELMPASQLANFIFVQPLVGVGLGTLWQKEPFTAWSAAGGALILVGVFAATRERENA